MRTFSLCILVAALLPVFCGCDSEPAATADVGTSGLRQVSATEPAREATPASGDDATADGAKKPKPIFARPRSRIRNGGIMDIDFDYLAFDIEVDADFDMEMLTEQVTAMDDKEIILRGFILDASIYSQKGIKKFVLIRDNQECCFGPGAKICHNVLVDMDEGKTASFSFRPVEVRGKFSIQLFRDPGDPKDGKVYSVYHMQASSVKPAG